MSNEGDIWTLLVRGKGDRERFVPLPVAIRSVLAAHMNGGGPMFRRPDGRPFTADGVSEKASDHLHGLGQPHTLHTLRHRFATRLFGLSKDIRVTQEMLGHASPSTTAIYVKHSVVAARSNLDRLSKELSAR